MSNGYNLDSVNSKRVLYKIIFSKEVFQPELLSMFNENKQSRNVLQGYVDILEKNNLIKKQKINKINLLFPNYPRIAKGIYTALKQKNIEIVLFKNNKFINLYRQQTFEDLSNINGRLKRNKMKHLSREQQLKVVQKNSNKNYIDNGLVNSCLLNTLEYYVNQNKVNKINAFSEISNLTHYLISASMYDSIVNVNGYKLYWETYPKSNVFFTVSILDLIEKAFVKESLL